jgi:HK97 family phage portal protein
VRDGHGNALELRERAVERRDPTAATTALQWRHKGLPIVQEWDAEQAFRAGYVANVIAYRCVQLRANAISSIPIVAGKNPRKPHQINENAPIAKLLGPPPGGPAPKLSARKLIRWTVGQEIVTGRRAWEIETHDGREDGMPVAFWPLASSSLREIPTERGVEWFRLFEYGSPMDPKELKPGHVFYGWDPSGTDFRKAESAIGAARYDLSLVTLCDRYGMSFLQNNAVPAAVVTTTRFPDDETRQAFKRQWSHEFGGVDNAGRTSFHEVEDGDGPVENEISIKVLGLSAKDSRLIETRKEAMMEIAIALGTPWSKLDASGRTYENADAEDRDFWENTILPDLIDLQDDINMQLAPRLGDDVVWFDLSGVRALARKILPITQSVGAPALLQARIMTINEARADYGLVALDDGDRMLTDEEVALFQGGGDQTVRDFLIALELRSVIDADSTEIEPVVDPPSPPALPPAPVVEDRAVDLEAVELRRATIWRSTDATVTTIEGRWTKAFRRLFAKQADATVSRLTGKRGRQALEHRAAEDPIDTAALFDVAFWTIATAEIAEDLYAQAVGAGQDRIAMSFGISFDLEAPWVEEMLAARSNQLAGQVTQTTYDSIVAAMTDGVAAGESIDDLATRIRGVFTVASESRAETIARTEVISAYNGASVRSVMELPRDVVLAQEWIATRGARTRDSHAAADGQVQLIGVPFSVGGHTAGYPGDPSLPAAETVNCRCAVAFLTPNDYEALDRARPMIDTRSANLAVALVRPGEFDELAFRRTLEGAAA